jgi:hypothetical protein
MGRSVVQGVALAAKPVQDRFASTTVSDPQGTPVVAKSTKTAEVLVPTASVATAPAQ